MRRAQSRYTKGEAGTEGWKVRVRTQIRWGQPLGVPRLPAQID
jgi:hypothetical protein